MKHEQRPQEVEVFRDRYLTPDGTAIRDYVHIIDLADAHVRALNFLLEPGHAEFLNLGTRHGYSVMQVIETAREITGREIRSCVKLARPGDPTRLVADHARAKKLLGSSPSSESSLDREISLGLASAPSRRL
jgi:UDP-glucose 4-epimerase